MRKCLPVNFGTVALQNTIAIRSCLACRVSFEVIDETKTIELASNHTSKEILLIIEFMNIKRTEIFFIVNTEQIWFGKETFFGKIEEMRKNFRLHC